MDINKDVEEAINKQLPATVGDVLRKRLEQASADALELDVQRKARLTLLDEARDLKLKLSGAEARAKRQEELDVLAAALATRERELRVRELTQDLAAEKRISVFAVDIVTKLVRNTEFRREAFGSAPLLLPPSYPGGQPINSSGPTSDNSKSEAA